MDVTAAVRRLAGARRPRGGDRGASAVELAVLAPALLLASLLIIQFALWFDARHAALAAAHEGDLVAREDFVNGAGWASLAEQQAASYYHGLDTGVLSGFSPRAFQVGPGTVSVTVSGTLNGIWPLTVTETVTGPIECFRTQASQGAQCGR